MYDVLIIGGGASGIVGAISLKKKNPNLNILILEKKDSLGLKILASGNGKCNISNTTFFGYEKIESFFKSIGIDFFIDDCNRAYPITRNSKDVLNSLKLSLKDKGIEYKLNAKVSEIKEEQGYFKVFVDEKIYEGRKVVIATGGKSYPKLGTTGDGYVFLKKLGLNVKPLIPGLVPITVKEELACYKGIRQKGKASLLKDGEMIKEEEGEIQFRENALSGICIMNLSNHIRKGHNYVIKLDFSNYEINPKIKSPILDFNVTGLLGWKDAQVTCGGLDLEEIDDNYEVKKIKGLYVLGETLDIQYECGGFNLSNAFYSGIVFGEKFEI